MKMVYVDKATCIVERKLIIISCIEGLDCSRYDKLKYKYGKWGKGTKIFFVGEMYRFIFWIVYVRLEVIDSMDYTHPFFRFF